MSKRSKIVVIIIIVVIVLTLISFLDLNDVNDRNLEKWEEEIVIQDNQLDPLEEKVGSNSFLIDVALKIEGLINKVFDIVLDFFNFITTTYIFK